MQVELEAVQPMHVQKIKKKCWKSNTNLIITMGMKTFDITFF